MLANEVAATAVSLRGAAGKGGAPGGAVARDAVPPALPRQPRAAFQRQLNLYGARSLMKASCASTSPRLFDGTLHKGDRDGWWRRSDLRWPRPKKKKVAP